MSHRPSALRKSPLEAEDQKTLNRLVASTFLTREEKLELEKMRSGGDKGDFEQESLGKPSPSWPFYQHKAGTFRNTAEPCTGA